MRILRNAVIVMRSCFFIGHRETDERILSCLLEAVERLILEEDAGLFYVGGYGGFDRAAGEAVIRLKARYPRIRLYRVLAYHPAERPAQLPAGYDGTLYPDGMEGVPRRYAIIRANQKMVDACDFLIVYAVHPASNAQKLLEYAERRQAKGTLRIVRISERF